MASYTTPMLLLTGASFINHWYNTKSWDWKIPLEGAVATGILGLVAQAPGAAPVATGIAWTAFLGMMLAPVQKPSPVQNLLTIAGTK